MNLYVSKLGDHSDGSSWQNAFHTIQAALEAVPDDRGGHRIAIRPDTYVEANLHPACRGARGRYNELVGDTDGRLGSGTRGRVVVDSGDPKAGFKSQDWWSTIRAYKKGWSPSHTLESFSSIVWDRWALRGLYATGSDAGIFFDGTDRVEPFSVLVEDCVGIGRAFGGGVAGVLSRPDEPILFRRCRLWSMDWWGDAAGAYVRVENPTVPDAPDVLFEDCTMVGPQCSLKAGNYGFHTYTWAKVANSRLVTLNFSQPHGTPADGIVQSVEHGRYLKVDFEDCTLMGYKVFGVKVAKGTEDQIGYTARGATQAYVQFQQEVPEGFHRLGHWPADVFAEIVPRDPKPPRRTPGPGEWVRGDMCELSPVVWRGRLLHLECVRPPQGGGVEDYYLRLTDAEAGSELTRFAEGHGLASVLVHEDRLYVFASRYENGTWNDVTLFQSSDLTRWERKVVLRQEKEHLFNTSVCRGPDGFVMAYESDDPTYPPFTIKFARSNDLVSWTKLRDAVFGTNRYAACPCIRYVDGRYYMLYLEHRRPLHVFQTYIARSADLRDWELSSANPVLAAEGMSEGINASDPELVESEGRTYLYYCVGDQLTWMNMKRVVHPGPMKDFLTEWFRDPGIRDAGTLSMSE